MTQQFVSKRARIYCSSLAEFRSIYLISCDADYGETAFLCEKIEDRRTEREVVAKPAVILPLPVNRTTKYPTVKCHSGQLVLVAWACNSQVDCWKASGSGRGDADEAMSLCSGMSSPVPPSFLCADGIERVSYTVVCNSAFDCTDRSDEDFCHQGSCQDTNFFRCHDTKCILGSGRCDGVRNCRDASDEVGCEGDEMFLKRTMDIRPPAIVHFNGGGVFSVQAMDRFSDCPETHFQCPDFGYCLPVYLLCNGVYDCASKEDERDCNTFTCPGFYQCYRSKVCLHVSHLCDGWPQCPQLDDEQFCSSSCPRGCHCYVHSFLCRKKFDPIRFYELRYLNADDSGFQLHVFGKSYVLIYLSLVRCNIHTLGSSQIRNVRFVDLSYNNIKYVYLYEIAIFPRIKSLTLTGNPLIFAFDKQNISSLRLPSLTALDVSFVEIPYLDNRIIQAFPNLQFLNVSNSKVSRLPEDGLQLLTSLRTLDARGCPVVSIPRSVFKGLNDLQRLFADNYKLCCSAFLPEGFPAENCEAPFDEVSSCEALLRSNWYRVALSVIAFLSVVGNAFSFLFRVLFANKKNKKGFAVFVTHLCIADLLMGLYLVIIGLADRIYMGTYLWEDITWRNSIVCKLAGFLSVVSNEMSAFVICMITVDRFIVLRFPFSHFHFRKLSAHISCVFLWTLAIVLAVCPLMPFTSHWSFYSQTGICIPLPVTRKDFPGKDYAFSVMIILNFILFFVIAVGQVSIYLAIRSQAMLQSDTTVKTNDRVIARRLLSVVFSDFLCWFPVGLLGLLASQGFAVPGEVTVGIAIFVLPLNSALNPFLYTLSMIEERRIRYREEKLLKIIESQIEQSETLAE